jgi:hypothetical protein
MPTVTQFDTTAMLMAMEQLQPAQQFLTSTFFPRTEFFEGRFAQVDSKKARRPLAPITKRGQPGRVLVREGITTRFFETPELKPTRVTVATDLDERLPGESSYSRRSADERLAQIIAKDLAELTDSCVRRIEKMSSDLLLTGSISYVLDDASVETLAYGSVTTVVPPVLWDAASGADPIGDLASAVSAIVTASGLLPDTLVLGGDCLTAFLAAPSVQDALNKLHLIQGGIAPSPPQGIGVAQFLGRLFRPYLNLYAYDESYEDEVTGALKLMLPSDTCILGCSTSSAVVSYGSITQVEADGSTRTYSDVKYVPRRLATPREDKVETRVACRPTLIPYDLAAHSIIKPVTVVLAAEAKKSSKKEDR